MIGKIVKDTSTLTNEMKKGKKRQASPPNPDTPPVIVSAARPHPDSFPVGGDVRMWRGMTGLTNPCPFGGHYSNGNRCFLNSSLQFLASIPSVISHAQLDAAERLHHVYDAVRGHVVESHEKCFKALLLAVAFGKAPSLSSDIAFRGMPAPYCAGNQEDVHEFLTDHVLGMFDNSFPCVNYTSAVYPLNHQCSHAGSAESTERFITLTVPEGCRQVKFQNMIERFVSCEEHLPNRECTECQTRSPAIRKQFVTLQSDYCVFHIALWDDFMRKRNIQVDGVKDGFVLKCADLPVEMDPICIIHHSGRTSRSGHYVVTRRSVEGLWVSINDEVVTEGYSVPPDSTPYIILCKVRGVPFLIPPLSAADAKALLSFEGLARPSQPGASMKGTNKYPTRDFTGDWPSAPRDSAHAPKLSAVLPCPKYVSKQRLHDCTFANALFCAVETREHSFLRSVAAQLPSFDLAVREVRAVLLDMDPRFKIDFTPLGDRGSDPHVSLIDREKLFSAVLKRHPAGSLWRLFDEENKFNIQVREDFAANRTPRRTLANNRSYLQPKCDRGASSLTAPSQMFRSTALEDNGIESSSSASRKHVQKILDAQSPRVRRCLICSAILLGGSSQAQDPFRELDSFCCGLGTRQHELWTPLPHRFDHMVYTKCARVINCLLSPTTIHGDAGEGLGYRYLSYQAPVMTINGQLYSRFMRSPSNCWFLNDSSFDERMRDCLQSDEQLRMLHEFYFLLIQNHPLRAVLKQGWTIADAIREDHRVWVTLEEDTRMCAVYIGQESSAAGPRTMHVLGGHTTIREDDPEWELFGYPIIHFDGNARKAWFPGKLDSKTGRPLKLMDYLRSVIMTQPGFWKYGRLAEQFILDTWARQDQMHVGAMRSEKVQGRLREYARACGRSFGPDKVFLPANEPGSHAYQRRFFHDVLHISRHEGASHLFITFTCNPNWPEVTALLGGHKPDFTSESHQAVLQRVFVDKLRQFIHRLRKCHD